MDNAKENMARNNNAFINEPSLSNEPSSYSLKLIVWIAYTASHSNKAENPIIWIILSFIEHEDGSILL